MSQAERHGAAAGRDQKPRKPTETQGSCHDLRGPCIKALTESSKIYPYPRGLAGPEIVDLGGLNGPLVPENPLEKVGGEAPYLFQWAWR